MKLGSFRLNLIENAKHLKVRTRRRDQNLTEKDHISIHHI